MTPTSSELELDKALKAVRAAPSDFVAWDALEAQAATYQAPEPVAELYVEVLAGEIPLASSRKLRERALRFGEEWFGDDAPHMQAILARVFGLEPSDEVIFERLVVSLTAAGRWDALLSVYERALAAADSLERRAALLEEAAKVAKDLANDEPRALSLQQSLLALRPHDSSLRSQLERLLEKSGRYLDLVLSLSGRDEPEPAAKAALEARIAGLWLRQLRSAPRALEIVQRLLAQDKGDAAALELAEEIYRSEHAPVETRRRASALLLASYEGAERAPERTRVLRAGQGLYEGEEREGRQREAARLLRQRSPAEALAEFSDAFTRTPGDDALLSELEQHANEAGLQGGYADTLEQAAARADSPKRRYQLLLRAASVAAGALEQPERAQALYRAVLAQTQERELALEAGRALDALLTEQGDQKARLDVLARQAELEPGKEARRELYLTQAKVALELGDQERALDAHKRRLADEPRDPDALDAVVDLYEQRQEWQPLIATLRQRASTLGGRLAARDFGRIGEIYAEQLHDLDSALSALAQLHQASPELAAERALGGLLGRAAAREAGGNARLSSSLGDSYRSWLKDAESALGHYARALAIDPTLESARAGLRALLSDQTVLARAADVLAGAYATSDDVTGLLDLLPYRLVSAGGSAERARLLRQAAQLEASRRNAPEAAFAHAAAAALEEPADPAGDLELWRLAEQLGNWAALADLLRKVAKELEPNVPRHAQLRISEAELSELRLEDLPRALEAYQAAAKALPSDAPLAEAVCRVAALLGRYTEAFEVVVALADRQDQVPDGLLRMLEERAAESGGFAALAAGARGVLVKARVNAPVRRELLLRVAEWYEQRAGDLDAAEGVLLDAAKLGGPHAETLRRLSLLQRRKPGRALFDTLLISAELHDRDLGHLAEAAELARDVLRDEARERTVLERLVQRSAGLLRAGQRAADGTGAEPLLVDATARLADKLSAADETTAELGLLSDVAALPIAKDKAAGFAERAARLALQKLSDSELGITLYQRALELSPHDTALLAALGAEYDRAGKLDDLVVLRRRELLATSSVSRRLELRLELARVLGALEARGGRLAALRENLREVPGHQESIDSVESILRAQSALTDVFALLSQEASQLEAIGETHRAALLWRRASALADSELHDEERALTAYQKLAGLEHDDNALESLARIRLGRGEPGLAVPWLERSLETRASDERVSVRVRLAQAQQAAGNVDAAIRNLEAGVKETPEAYELRDLLADLYERHARYEPLAALLAESATRTGDRQLLLAYARKAAQLYARELNAPERSVTVLSRAVVAHPEDRPLKIEFVDALIASGKLGEARAVLTSLVDEYGRRRSPERAELHMRLSRVAKAEGNIEEALAQLDQAASMDRAHPATLRSLGELAIEAKQLERAERAYRTLLLLVKKPAKTGNSIYPPAPTSESDVGAAEVLYQLHRIAAELGQTEKAAELLEQAVQTAVTSELETARLKALLLERGDAQLLLRVLELRLAQVSSAETEAEVLSDLAEVLESTLDRKEEAFAVRLKSLASAPGMDALHSSTLRLAEQLGRERAYVDAVLALEERARRKDDLVLASDLALRAGSVSEHQLKDFDTAGSAYRTVSEGAPGYVEAQFALARVAGKTGHEDEERTVLERIALLPDEPSYVEGKRNALYRLVELRVQQPETRDEGLLKLSQLVNVQPDYARASQILKLANERDPKDLRTLTTLEQMARQSGEPTVLLDALERRVKHDDVPLPMVREAVELALSLDEGARAELLLRRALVLAEARDQESDATWAPVLLARTLQKHGDADGALDWLEKAMLVSDPGESFELGLEVAATAARPGGDRARAIRVYEQLRERDPKDRRVWGPLLTFYKEDGELERLLSVVRTTLEALDGQVDRNALRLTTARMLFDSGREAEGTKLLEDVLSEDPDHAEAALRLADLYERRGQQEQLVELLNRKLESARERRSPSVVPLSLRMGAMLAETKPEHAAELYKQALELVPDSDVLLHAAIEQTSPEEHAEERAALIMRYLASDDAASRADAPAYARWLVELRSGGADLARFEQALEVAHRVVPNDGALRRSLARFHRENANHARLADLLLEEAEAEGTADDRQLELLSEAAELQLKLAEPGKAAKLLRQASALAPADFGLLKRSLRASASAGELGATLGEIDVALAEPGRDTAQRVELLMIRADTAAMAAMHDEAVVALSTAHQLAGDSALEPLLAGIERARAAARERGQLGRERELTLRLATLFRERGDLTRAIEVLESWMQRATSDLPTLRELLELTIQAKRWGDALVLGESLCVQEDGEGLGRAVDRLVEAAHALGRLELARPALERALEREPNQPRVVQLLEQLYLQLGDKRAIAKLLAVQSEREREPEKRFEQFRRVGQLLVDAGDADSAMTYLKKALEAKPDDLPTVISVADAHIAAGRSGEARELIERTMGALRQRRSPELGQLRHRMAKLLQAEGDEQGRFDWLNAALEADMNNGEVASELAVVAQDHGQLDVSLKALRAITMMKGEAPMSRAEAFYRQAIIVAQKGEPRRAVLWAKKAKAEDQHFPGVDRLIAELESA
jgi:lipopolysaccharide biosynthesis regulator YciM